MFIVTPNANVKIFSGDNCNEVMNKLKEFLQNNINIRIIGILYA